MGDNDIDARGNLTFPSVQPRGHHVEQAFWSFLALLAAVLASSPAAQQRPRRHPERDFLSRVRRLTVEGRRAGEGYWSPDGVAARVPERARAGQSLLPDLRAGSRDRRRQTHLARASARRRARSSGRAATRSCSRRRIAIRSRSSIRTKSSPSARRARSAATRGTTTRRWTSTRISEKTGALKRLTTARGYDAEASYSPDGQWIVVLVDARRLRPQPCPTRRRSSSSTDPSYFAEIYIMRADGSGQKRLTTSPGYDGGPFFTPRRLAHCLAAVRRAGPHRRRLDDEARTASDARQITDFGAMSWAPYEHPSGEYIIFASNKLGFENFEVFMVDTAGTKEPVRVTYSDGFDGLPVPSPDGRQLAWTSSRVGRHRPDSSSSRSGITRMRWRRSRTRRRESRARNEQTVMTQDSRLFVARRRR